MADLRSRFIEDYAGGLLNVSRQELSTTGEVLSQDGFPSEGAIFVEDGSGVKSGLKLGVSIAESVDPTTELGVVNVRFADRTYAKIRDLRIFTTAIASAQAALSEATSTSVSNLETTLQLLEDDISTLDQNIQNSIDSQRQQLQELNTNQLTLFEAIAQQETEITQLKSRVRALENPVQRETEFSIAPLTITTNQVYYPGTIRIIAGIATGTNTQFSSSFSTGSKFISTTASGEDVEFTVRGFDSANANTSMSVTPTDKDIPTSSLYRKNQILELQNKINEILLTMTRLNLIV